MQRSMAAVKAIDTTGLDFRGYCFRILGWYNGYLKLLDESGTDRLPMMNEGEPCIVFDSVYDLLSYVETINKAFL